MIGIIDYGAGNSKSICNILRKIGIPSIITANPDDLHNASKIIIPGVGSFDNAMIQLDQSGFVKTLHHVVLEKKIPVLGICLGMQLLAKTSEEGTLPGLGWIDGEAKRFNFIDFKPKEKRLKIPHMGWNQVNSKQSDDSILAGISRPMRFYFVHSYHFVCNDPNNILATAHHGHEFTCAVRKDNIYGVQFHPEKSHRFGMQMLKNFAEKA
ncbi:MAG: imidazole glycerol phosphate synthase subunit HisH [Candidatus Electrothrix sp. AR3]|nr:imidazole glycerol phosphate synthase subunit HisH [Candidatus Electrothrix sp. AR3]